MWQKLIDSTDKKWQGNGSAINRLSSNGELTLALPPRAFVLLEREN
jgi:hypothetical protein